MNHEIAHSVFSSMAPSTERRTLNRAGNGNYFCCCCVKLVMYLIVNSFVRMKGIAEILTNGTFTDFQYCGRIETMPISNLIGFNAW